MAKICMIAYTLYPSDPRVRREAEALVKRGDTVDFICLQEATVSERQNYKGVQLFPLPVGRYQGTSTFSYVAKYASFLFRSGLLVTRLFFEKRYDIIQVHTMPDALVFASLMPRLFGARVILDVHDLMPELYMCKFASGPNQAVVRMITWIERLSIRFAHKAIAVHDPHLEALVAHGVPRDKLTVVMNVPDPLLFQRNAEPRSDQKFRLIYHGTVARRHGLEVALKAVRSVKDLITNLEFQIIGRGDDLERISRLAEEMDLGECVRFLQPMPTHDLARYLTQADIGIVPILYDPFTRYMLPLKLMEYVRMQVPCIVSETETIRCYFDDDMVRFFKPGDAHELSTSILDLYRNPHVRSRLAANASRFDQAYNWEQQKRRYFKVVDSLL